jgi:hypothetical protein
MSSAASAQQASLALHERVRAFAADDLGGVTRGVGAPAQAFEELALDIARYQAEHNPVLKRLVRHHSARLDSLADVPAVPADAFRLGRVAAHEPALDVARFYTSGTTGGAGMHAFRSLDTYRALSLSWGRRALLAGVPDGQRVTVLALAAPFEPERRSSLGFMMQEFMQDFDARPLVGAAHFDPLEAGRWLLGPGKVDLDALRRGALIAENRNEPLLLLATSFGLAWLIEALAGANVRLPPGSRIMQTGGFKGHVRSLDDGALAAAIHTGLGIEPTHIIGEYGMTELTSQLYDTGFRRGASGDSEFVEPPWLRVTPVDPVSLRPVPAGEVGLAQFTDLGNVDSALKVLTHDQVRRVPGGLCLLGRRPGARLRGCSLAVEALASTSGSGASRGSAASTEVEP